MQTKNDGREKENERILEKRREWRERNRERLRERGRLKDREFKERHGVTRSTYWYRKRMGWEDPLGARKRTPGRGADSRRRASARHYRKNKEKVYERKKEYHRLFEEEHGVKYSTFSYRKRAGWRDPIKGEK